MVKVNVNLGDRSYPIYITTDYTWLGKCLLSSRISGRCIIITDNNVDKYQAAECIDAIRVSGLNISKYVFEAGEKNKNLDTIKDIYKFLIDEKIDRDSTLIALGGGVVGDIVGFAAATFLRGINFVQVPTSLLAQADSSVGGKVGVDFAGSKNIIGAFYQPKLVYMNVNALKTLPKRDVVSGLAEVIKHGFISDLDFYEYIDYNAKKIFEFDENVLQFIAKTNCSIKGKVVEEDEKESGIRANLNFGHTIGHAIESASNFELMHGECVALGMVGAFKMSQQLGMISEDMVNKAVVTIEKLGLPTSFKDINLEKVFNQMFYDKKIKNDKLVFILPKAIGNVIQLSIDDHQLIKNVLNELGN